MLTKILFCLFRLFTVFLYFSSVHHTEGFSVMKGLLTWHCWELWENNFAVMTSHYHSNTQRHVKLRVKGLQNQGWQAQFCQFCDFFGYKFLVSSPSQVVSYLRVSSYWVFIQSTCGFSLRQQTRFSIFALRLLKNWPWFEAQTSIC